MSTTHQLTISFGNGGAPTVSGKVTRQANVEANLAPTINTGTYNEPYSWPIVPANLLDLFIYSQQAVTLSLNGVNDVWTITPPGSGTFTFTFNAITTGAIAFNATTAVFAAAVQGLSSCPTTLLRGVPTANLQVTGPNGGPWVVTCVGQLGLAPQTMSVSTGTASHTTTGVVPPQTISIVAGESEEWRTNSGLKPSNPITVTVTTLSITNTSGGSTTVNVEAGLSQ